MRKENGQSWISETCRYFFVFSPLLPSYSLSLSLSLQFLLSTSKFPCKLTFLFIATEFAQNFHKADEVFYCPLLIHLIARNSSHILFLIDEASTVHSTQSFIYIYIYFPSEMLLIFLCKFWPPTFLFQVKVGRPLCTILFTLQFLFLLQELL